MPDPFTLGMRLCDNDGMVAGTFIDELNRLRALTRLEPWTGDPFVCTGDAHLAGEHIRCTSPAHDFGSCPEPSCYGTVQHLGPCPLVVR